MHRFPHPTALTRSFKEQLRLLDILTRYIEVPEKLPLE
jgi:hypothetical protein